MWRTVLGAGIGGAVCFPIGLCAALGLGRLAGLNWSETVMLAAIVGGALGLPGSLVGAGAGRCGSPLPLVDDSDAPDGPDADYREPSGPPP